MSLQRPSVFTWPHGQWERCRYTITQYFWCVNVSANAPLSPKEGFAAALCIRLRAPRDPLRRQGWGNIPLLRRGNGVSSLPALTQSAGDAGEKRCDVACQGQRGGCTAASLPLVPFRNVLLPGPLPCSLVGLLRPLVGPVPGLSRTEGHKSRANSEVFIFSKNPHLAS